MTTIATTARPAGASSRKRFIIRHPVVAYFALAFAGTWGVQLPMLLSQDGLGLLPYTVPVPLAILLVVLSGYAGPASAALGVTAAESGRAGIRHFLHRYVRWQVGLRWYLVVLLGYPLLYLLTTTLFMGLAPLHALAAKWTVLFTSYLPNLLLLQGITQWAEEPGWRGFALPRLQKRFSPVPASLILGLLHGLWHLPFFVYTAGPVAFGPFDLSAFALNTALGAVVAISWTWVYNNSGGSILLAVLLHSSFNASSPLIGQLIPTIPDEVNRFVAYAPVVFALLLVVATRGRLSYREVPARDTQATDERGTGD